MELKRLQELAGIQSTTLRESVEDNLQLLQEAATAIPQPIQDAVEKISSFKPQIYAAEIKAIFADFEKHKKEKKLQSDLLKLFKDDVIPDTKRNLFKPIIPSPHKPRALVFVIESPVRALVVRTLFAELVKDLKAVGITFSIKIDSKTLLKDYAVDPQSKNKYAFELSLYTAEEVKALKQETKQQKEEEANPKSEEEQKATEESNFTTVEEIFKRSMKFKHPDFHKVKKGDRVLEEYFDKIATVKVILGQFHNAGPATINNLKQTYKGEDISSLVKAVEDLQSLLKKFEDEIEKIVVPAAKDYVNNR